MDLVRVSHVHVGAVLKDVVVDHVNVGVGDGGAPVAGLVRAGQAAARVGNEVGGGGLGVGAVVLVLGAKVPVHVDRAPAFVRFVRSWVVGRGLWKEAHGVVDDDGNEHGLAGGGLGRGPRTCLGMRKTP